ncbi:hypothetical protein [Scytonema sp. PCC 10023]
MRSRSGRSARSPPALGTNRLKPFHFKVRTWWAAESTQTALLGLII